MNPDGVWEYIAESLVAGQRVWVHDPRLGAITRDIGIKLNGKDWLVVSNSRLNAKTKRLLDICGSIALLLMLSPLLLACAFLVKMSSRGPILFCTEVVGFQGRRFRWYKFRSMQVQAQQRASELHREERFKAFAESALLGTQGKILERSQVTAIGRVLRAFSLDELPQLWNVLRGDMSLVGPRPCLPYEAQFYSGWRARRFSVMPGLTGIWQVFGRGRSTFEEGAAMDVLYTFKTSLLFDSYLLLRTIKVVFQRKGAL